MCPRGQRDDGEAQERDVARVKGLRARLRARRRRTPVQERRIGQAGIDHRDAYAVFALLLHRGLGEADQPALGRLVADPRRVRPLGHLRREVDEQAAAPLSEDRKHGLRQRVGRVQIGRDQLVPSVPGQRGQRPVLDVDPDRVHQCVEPPVAFDRGAHRARGGLGDRGVAGHGDGLAAGVEDGAFGFPQPRGVAREQTHPRPGIGGAECDRTPDAAAGSRHQHDAFREIDDRRHGASRSPAGGSARRRSTAVRCTLCSRPGCTPIRSPFMVRSSVAIAGIHRQPPHRAAPGRVSTGHPEGVRARPRHRVRTKGYPPSTHGTCSAIGAPELREAGRSEGCSATIIAGSGAAREGG